MNSKKPVIGIMGAIASGKSFVSSIFGELGFGVVDADAIVRQLYQDKDFVNRALVPIFGEKVFDVNGLLDRGYISDIVFQDAGKLDQLNSVVHPAVASAMKKEIEVYGSDERVKGVVLDVPLLLETGLDKWCDYLVYVECDRRVCVQRAAKRSKISEKELEKRQKSQIFLDIKKNIANYIIYNNSEMSVIKRQVTDVISDVFRKTMENVS